MVVAVMGLPDAANMVSGTPVAAASFAQGRAPVPPGTSWQRPANMQTVEGTGVWVGELVGVDVGVSVGVAVDVLVAVLVGELVGVLVAVFVGVRVGVSVGVGV
jgi:hypothetical protein